MGDMMTRTLKRGDIDIELPGFRFHPTEEELLDFYLKNMMLGNKLRLHIIGFLNIYHHDPWDLPGLAKVGEREWYFFVPRDKKHGSGSRPNRTTQRGFWKATGSDRKIISLSDPKRVIGLRKTLVFYEGRAPRGSKTDWVMNEYRLPDHTTKTTTTQFPNDVVLCKIYRKATSLKVLEQKAAMEHDNNNNINQVLLLPNLKKESEEQEQEQEHEEQQVASVSVSVSETHESFVDDDNNKHQLQVQLPIITNMDWNQDPFISLINTPNSNWFSSYSPNILNF